MRSAAGGPVAGDGKLSVTAGDLLTATDADADDGAGGASIAYGTSSADCTPPVLTAVQVPDVTDDSATVRWTSSKPASGRVDWGATPALGAPVTSSILSANHVLAIKPLTECGCFHFRVSSTAAYGNTAVADVSGAPFQFNAYTVPGVLRRDAFESVSGWTLEGEWQIGAPEGRGSSPGDPTTAFFIAGC